MMVPFFTIKGVYEKQRRLVNDHLDRLFNQGDFVNGGLVREFEEAIKQYTGAKHAVAVGNASDGLAIAMIAAGVQPEAEVIVPALTFVS